MNLSQYFKKSEKEHFAIGQFNTYNFETIKAIILATKESNSPVIIGVSERGAKIMGLKEILNFVNLYRGKKNNIFLNIDHAKDWSFIKNAIDLGYDCVHFDGSKKSFEENIKMAKKIVSYAKKKGSFVEGEIEAIGESNLTDPNKALQFIKETGINSLAVNIGNIHGISASGVNPDLNITKLKEIKKITKSFLVLHGGSGTKEGDIKKSIKNGINKININTELKIAYVKKMKEIFNRADDKKIVYEYASEVIETLKNEVVKKMMLFNSKNKK